MTTLEFNDLSAVRLPRGSRPLAVAPETRALPLSRQLLEAGYRVAAAALLLLTLPLLCMVGLTVIATSPGGALFRQTRVGRGGRPFTMWKFRTMHQGADAAFAALRRHNDVSGPLFKLRNDPRVTKVGRWLRRSSLDELPQLWNVVRGDMSLVGPRPALPHEVAEFDSLARRRLEVKPGLTGLWQVSGRCELSWEDTVRLDVQYVTKWTVALELQILVRTAAAVALGAGAY